MFERAQDRDRELPSRKRAQDRMRDGHRREYGPRKQDKRLSFRERSERTLADVGIYRSVSFRDLAEAHFGGHPYTARRSVNLWIRAGALREHAAKGPKGNPYKVFTLTRAGAQLARRLAVTRGLDPGQKTWSGLVKHSELSHDTAIYRAVQVELGRLRESGARLTRVRIDAELKSAVARRIEAARSRDGKEAADKEQQRAAKELGLPVDEQGRVLYPDAQLEYIAADGRTGRVNIEVASGHYRDKSIHAKSKAGFTLHATRGNRLRVLKALNTPPSR